MEGNEHADRAAREALEVPGIHTDYLTYQDANLVVNRLITAKWQLRWNATQGKLKQIRPGIEPWPLELNRRGQVLITRLRIGHTRITHDYLMTRGRPPECPRCPTTILTVKHILIECPHLRDIRRKHRLGNSLKEILGRTADVERVIAFLTEIQLIEQI